MYCEQWHTLSHYWIWCRGRLVVRVRVANVRVRAEGGQRRIRVVGRRGCSAIEEHLIKECLTRGRRGCQRLKSEIGLLIAAVVGAASMTNELDVVKRSIDEHPVRADQFTTTCNQYRRRVSRKGHSAEQYERAESSTEPVHGKHPSSVRGT